MITTLTTGDKGMKKGKDRVFSILEGMTLACISITMTQEFVTQSPDNTDCLILHGIDGRKFKLYHEGDCCEEVYIESICGNLKDLIGSPILFAEEVSNSGSLKYDRESGALKNDCDDSFTWTFYKLATIKGSVTIRWYGTSNGYYSEKVDFVELRPKDIINNNN